MSISNMTNESENSKAMHFSEGLDYLPQLTLLTCMYVRTHCGYINGPWGGTHIIMVGLCFR